MSKQMDEDKQTVYTPRFRQETGKNEKPSCIQRTPKDFPLPLLPSHCLSSNSNGQAFPCSAADMVPRPCAPTKTTIQRLLKPGRSQSFGEEESNVISRSEHHVPMEKQSGEQTLTPCHETPGQAASASVIHVPRNCPGGTRAAHLPTGR